MYAYIVSNSQRGIDLRQKKIKNIKKFIIRDGIYDLSLDGIIFFGDGILLLATEIFRLQ